MQINSRSFLVSAGKDPAALKKKILDGREAELVQAVRISALKNASFADMLAAQTLHAADTGNLLADKAEIDFLLRVAGTTQIARAIEQAGTKAGEPFVLVVADRKASLEGLDRALNSPDLRRTKLTLRELAGIERAALLNVARA